MPMDAKLSTLLPYPFAELFRLDATAPAPSAHHIRRNVYNTMLTQAASLAQVCAWSLLTEEAKDNADDVRPALQLLADYLETIRRLWPLINESDGGEARGQP